MSVIKNNTYGGNTAMFKKFIRYLKEEKIFKLYFETLKNDNYTDNIFNFAYEHSTLLFFSTCPPRDWLTSCFTWSRQKEGRDFWEAKHYKWVDTADKIYRDALQRKQS